MLVNQSVCFNASLNRSMFVVLKVYLHGLSFMLMPLLQTSETLVPAIKRASVSDWNNLAQKWLPDIRQPRCGTVSFIMAWL